jgi:hypothetical protein
LQYQESSKLALVRSKLKFFSGLIGSAVMSRTTSPEAILSRISLSSISRFAFFQRWLDAWKNQNLAVTQAGAARQEAAR